FFSTALMNDLAEYQDGGLGNPNPTDIAMEEVGRMWRAEVSHDLILSFGTGREDRVPTSEVSMRRGTLRNSSAMRVFRWSWSRLESALNGDEVHRYMERCLDQAVYKRINTTFPHPLPRLDDAECIPDLRSRVKADCDRICWSEIKLSLAASCFFFELDSRPKYSRGGEYLCKGAIRARGGFCETRALLQSISQGRVQFLKNEERLADITLDEGLCRSCGKFNLPIRFFVSDLDNEVTISIRLENDMERRISSFPQRMSWFT
ncbi:hypothetical protein LTR86_011324, partial [Recurvomyces mirabilis]